MIQILTDNKIYIYLPTFRINPPSYIWSIFLSDSAKLSLNYLYFYSRAGGPGKFLELNWEERQDVTLIAYLISIIKLLICWSSAPVRNTISVSDK